MAKAVRRDPRDGRSWFLIAMMHLYRFGRMVEHWPDAGPDARAEVDAAHAAFEKAVRLSWDGTRGDTRVPGFAASAIFQKSFFGNDPAEIARGLDAIDTAKALNPLFNSFNFLGAVAPTLPWNDPSFIVGVDGLEGYLPTVAAQCDPNPEICFNDGLAAHNLEGTFLLFGDVFAKGHRVDTALLFYGNAVTGGESDAWQARFLDVALDRIAAWTLATN